MVWLKYSLDFRLECCVPHVELEVVIIASTLLRKKMSGVDDCIIFPGPLIENAFSCRKFTAFTQFEQTLQSPDQFVSAANAGLSAMNSKNTGNPPPRNKNGRIPKNPFPRLAMATFLMIWAGSNLWGAIFRWSEINEAEVWNRGLGMLLTILVTVLPMVIGIYLIWTIVVGPDDPRYNRGASSSERQKTKKKNA